MAVAAVVIVVIVMAVLRLMWSSYLYQKQRELYHRERMAALEKGVELPPVPESVQRPFFEGLWPFYRSQNPSYLLRGLVWLFLGISLMAFFYGLSTTTVTDDVPRWYFSVPAERRPVPPPLRRETKVPAGWALLGLMPAGVGLAYLIFYAAEGRRKAIAES